MPEKIRDDSLGRLITSIFSKGKMLVQVADSTTSLVELGCLYALSPPHTSEDADITVV
jgi:hypothetical protein